MSTKTQFPFLFVVQLRAAADGDVNTMRDAAKESTELDVSADGEQVRRTRPLPEVDDSGPRTVYVEGIGEFCTMEELQKAMSAYGKVLSMCVKL